jgi:hypothetical protein
MEYKAAITEKKRNITSAYLRFFIKILVTLRCFFILVLANIQRFIKIQVVA